MQTFIFTVANKEYTIEASSYQDARQQLDVLLQAE